MEKLYKQFEIEFADMLNLVEAETGESERARIEMFLKFELEKLN